MGPSQHRLEDWRPRLGKQTGKGKPGTSRCYWMSQQAQCRPALPATSLHFCTTPGKFQMLAEVSSFPNKEEVSNTEYLSVSLVLSWASGSWSFPRPHSERFVSDEKGALMLRHPLWRLSATLGWTEDFAWLLNRCPPDLFMCLGLPNSSPSDLWALEVGLALHRPRAGGRLHRPGVAPLKGAFRAASRDQHWLSWGAEEQRKWLSRCLVAIPGAPLHPEVKQVIGQSLGCLAVRAGGSRGGVSSAFSRLRSYIPERSYST